ncbi:MAG: peptide deformylase, partial [Dissulfurimicrobium sp.]
MKILVYPHEILRQKALPVKSIDGDIVSIIDEMFKTMYEAKGIGLAANQ